jgi:hypothetical protein
MKLKRNEQKKGNKQTQNKKHEDCVSFLIQFFGAEGVTQTSAKNAFTTYIHSCHVAESFKYQKGQREATKVICHTELSALFLIFLEMPKKS